MIEVIGITSYSYGASCGHLLYHPDKFDNTYYQLLIIVTKLVESKQLNSDSKIEAICKHIHRVPQKQHWRRRPQNCRAQLLMAPRFYVLQSHSIISDHMLYRIFLCFASPPRKSNRIVSFVNSVGGFFDPEQRIADPVCISDCGGSYACFVYMAHKLSRLFSVRFFPSLLQRAKYFHYFQGATIMLR